MTEAGLRLTLTPAEQERAAEVARLRAGGGAAVAPLVAMLTEPSWAVRREVVAALAAIGEPAHGPLCDVLRTHRDDEARLAAAVDALVLARGDVLATVTALADATTPAAVADAALILGRRRDARALPLLASLVAHPDDNVAIAAVEALGRIGGRAAVDVLLTAVSSGSFFRVYPALDVLGRSGDPRAVPALSKLLEQPVYALEAARALGRFGEASAVPPLARLLAHPSEAMVRVAAQTLSDLLTRNADRYGTDRAAAAAVRRASPGEVAIRQLVHAVTTADDAERLAIVRLLGILGGEHALGALGNLLDGAHPVAEAAAAALRAIGPPSDRALRSALRDGSSARRAVVLPVVTRASAAGEVMSCLDDPDPTVRALACDTLARLGHTGAVAKLFGLIGDPDPRARQAAVGAIQALGSDETKTLALAAVDSADPVVRRSALRVLAYFGFTAALPKFLEAIHQDDDERLRDAAIAGLPFLEDPRATDALLATARDPRERTRAAAIRALGLSPSSDPRIVATLLSALGDGDPWVRYYAAQAIGKRGVESATDTLAALLQDPAGQVRVSAVEALSHFRNPVAVARLRDAAGGADEDLRRAALIGLALAKRTEGYPVLAEAAHAEDPATRLVAISAIVDATSPDAVPVLAEAARDPDENVRSAAIAFLGTMPGHDAPAALVALAREQDDARERVLSALAVPAEGRVHGLARFLESADDDLAPLVASALARLGSPDAHAALFRALTSMPVPSRKAAAAALAAIGSREALDAMREAAAHDADGAVREICAVLLAG